MSVDAYVRYGELRIDVEELFMQLSDDEQKELIYKAAFDDIVEDILNVVLDRDIRFTATGKDRWIKQVRETILEESDVLERSHFKTLLHENEILKATAKQLAEENKRLRELVESRESWKIFQETRSQGEVPLPSDREVETAITNGGKG